MSSTDPYRQRHFWEVPDLSLLRGYLDKKFCEKVKDHGWIEKKMKHNTDSFLNGAAEGFLRGSKE